MRCGDNVGKENRKTLVERILRGFCVPGAGDENRNLRKVYEFRFVCIIC